MVEAAQVVILFGLNIGKIEFTGAFSLEKTCELLFVRGTTSFYNKKLQIFACWRRCDVEYSNVINEQC